MHRLRSLTVRQRLVSLIVLTAITLVAVTVVSVGGVERRITDERTVATQHAVETALGIVAHYGDLATAGTLGEDDAKEQALDALRSLRYGGEEYFWVNDMTPTMLMHPIKPELDGTDLSANEDPDGLRLFVRMVEVVQADGAGVVAYQWPKPGAEDPQPKISYVAGYEPWGWIVGSGIYVDDVRAAAVADARGILVVAALALALITVTGLAVARSITGPLARATGVLASGDLTVRLDEGAGRTELEHLAAALNGTLDRTAAATSQVTASASAVSAAVETLVGSSEQLSSAVQDTSERAQEIAVSAGQVATRIEAVAAGAHQMDASIGEISRNTADVAAIAGQAVDIAARTTGTVEELGASSAQIGSIVQVITGIAEQTNLLALNATIEAARAGDSGKGFAVVAGEVKDLAQETARATGEIAGQVEAIQGAVARAVEEIAQISDVVRRIDDYQSTIAGAVEEQSATTASMAGSVQEAADGGRGIESGLAVVEQSHHRSLDSIGTIRDAAHDLRSTATRLEESVAALRG